MNRGIHNNVLVTMEELPAGLCSLLKRVMSLATLRIIHLLNLHVKLKNNNMHSWSECECLQGIRSSKQSAP